MLEFTDKELKTDYDEKYKLSQFGIGFVNRLIYYQVKIDNENFSIVYPDKSNKEEAFLIIPNDSDTPSEGTIVYKMNRKGYPKE